MTVDDDENDGWNVVSVPRKKKKRNGPMETTQSVLQQDNNNSLEKATTTPFMMLLVGLPGSGKSTFAKSLEKGNRMKFTRINQDQLGSRQACLRVCQQVLEIRNCPIIDRCNFNSEQRESFIRMAQEYNMAIDCVIFNFSKDECIERCQSRSHHETIARGQERAVVSSLAKLLQNPSPRSNVFRTIHTISTNQQSNQLVLNYLNSLHE